MKGHSCRVGLVGFEPTTSCSQSRRAAKLRHSPVGALYAWLRLLLSSFLRYGAGEAERNVGAAMTETARFGTVDVETSGAVGTLLLNDPDRLNSLSHAMLDGIIEATQWLDGRNEVRVVVVRGAGRLFTAGADLDEFGLGAAGRELRDRADLGRRAADAVEAMAAVTVARIHGHCVGGGVVLAAACDLRVGESEARFQIPEVDIGIPLIWGGVHRLVREIGPTRTRELVMTARPFSADEAHQLGFLSHVVDPTDLDAAVGSIVNRLVDKPARALLETKRHINEVASGMVRLDASATDADRFLDVISHNDVHEAMADYVARVRAR